VTHTDTTINGEIIIDLHIIVHQQLQEQHGMMIIQVDITENHLYIDIIVITDKIQFIIITCGDDEMIMQVIIDE
jgi:hypothetical protein